MSGRRRALVALCVSAPVIVAVTLASGVGAHPGTPVNAVPTAQPKAVGIAPPDVVSPGLQLVPRAEGADPLENPSGDLAFYGYKNNGTMVPALGSNAEASKTEPDKNTYLVLKGQTGPDSHYYYGSHFVFQGHETGGAGYITRVNLDADAAHKVTVLATTDTNGSPVPTIDGSTWDPFAKKLLFTSESGANQSIIQLDANYKAGAKATDISGIVGRGAYEGVQTDKDGNLWLVEDAGGTTINGAKLPNSFVYRFVPNNKSDLTAGGKLQVLQVKSLRTGQPIIFHGSAEAEQAIFGGDIQDLHAYGKKFATSWVTIHDTAVDGTTPYDANALAKAKNGTPFKRPENGVFRPGTNFGEFYFSETGDTSATSPANDSSRSTTQLASPDNAFGGLGGIMRLSQKTPSSDSGVLSLAVKGDLQHTGFDNVTFWDRNNLAVVEDAGDGLHTQRNALDSGFLYDVSHAQPQAVRFLAEGRDPSATIDSGVQGTAAFQNEGDNEITGIHVSDGDPSKEGLLGAQIPQPFHDGWRVFWTQQHGNNVLWEIERG